MNYKRTAYCGNRVLDIYNFEGGFLELSGRIAYEMEYLPNWKLADRIVFEGNDTIFTIKKGNNAQPKATQIGGDHYSKYKIQPIDYITDNGLDYIEGNVIKYITRHQDKGGAEDIKKAIHYCELLLAEKYGENTGEE